MRFAVVMDPLETVQVDHDTTYVLIKEAARRGHAIHHVGPSGVMFRGDRVELMGRRVTLTDDPDRPFHVEPPRALTGDDLDVVLIRTDPPFDADYLTVTQLLDLLPDRVFILNHPSGLRAANEKLAALRFPELCPPTCVSQDPAQLEAFRNEMGGSVVLKPLDGHGGSGVLLVREGDPNRATLLRAITREGRAKALAQAVVPDAEQGDKRIIVLDGHPLGAVLRRNDTGGFVHNLAAGGVAHRAEIRDDERSLCDRLAPWLRQHGLWLAGLDVIGGKLIEINVTSPTCVQEINRLNGVKLEQPILDFIERNVGRPRRFEVTSPAWTEPQGASGAAGVSGRIAPSSPSAPSAKRVLPTWGD